MAKSGAILLILVGEIWRITYCQQLDLVWIQNLVVEF